MKEAPGSAATLHAALLDYFGAPGKYQLGLRQPALLFSSIREILQLAAGRGAPGAGQDTERLRDAAAFFIRAALLFPGADHYAVLGLPTAQEPTDLKDRYRLLMRLTHPDFMPSGSAAWPSDAAVRVNRAYEVLSSPTLRREYDEQLAALRSQRPSAVRIPPTMGSRPRPRVPHHGKPRFGAKAGWALGLGSVLAVALLVWPRTDPDQLVQRGARPAPAPAVEQARTPLPPPVVAASEPAQPAGVATLPSSPPVAEAAVPPVAALPVPVAPLAAGSGVMRLEIAPSASAQMPVARPIAVAVPAPAPPAGVAPRSLPVAPLPAAAPPGARPRPATDRPGGITLATHEEPTGPASLPPLPPPAGAVAVVIAPAVTPIPSASVAARPAATVSAVPIPTPTLSDAQPLLTQVLQMLETGSGEQLLRLLEADARKQPGAVALSRQYEQLVRGGRPIRLSQVEFKGEPRDGVLLVTGRIHMHAGEPTIGSHGERLVLKAEFAQKGGKVQLTGLSGAAD